jgi:hypothetical protein
MLLFLLPPEDPVGQGGLQHLKSWAHGETVVEVPEFGAAEAAMVAEAAAWQWPVEEVEVAAAGECP